MPPDPNFLAQFQQSQTDSLNPQPDSHSLAQNQAQPTQQSQQPAMGPQMSGIKGYLSNIFYNMGEAAKAHLGMQTDVQIQQNQQRVALQQQQIDQQKQLTDSTVQLHQAQVEQMKTMVPVRLPDGTTMSMPYGLALKMFPASVNAQGKVLNTQEQNKGKIDIQTLRNQSPLTVAQANLANSTADLKDAMNDPSSPAFGLALKKVQWSNYFKQAALDNQNRRIAFQQNGPTQNIRTQGQMSAGLLEHLPTIQQEIANLGAQGKLGPLAGRWNEFLAGKVGNGDPDYVALRTDLSLFSTALMKAHVGARGSEFIMKHFQSLIDSGKMSPESLDAAMGSISGYLNTYVKMGQFNPANAAPPAAPLAPAQNPFRK